MPQNSTARPGAMMSGTVLLAAAKGSARVGFGSGIDSPHTTGVERHPDDESLFVDRIHDGKQKRVNAQAIGRIDHLESEGHAIDRRGETNQLFGWGILEPFQTQVDFDE